MFKPRNARTIYQSDKSTALCPPHVFKTATIDITVIGRWVIATQGDVGRLRSTNCYVSTISFLAKEDYDGCDG